MNKYQEAVITVKEQFKSCYDFLYLKIPLKVLNQLKLLQELVDKQEPKKVKKKLKAISPIHDIVVGTCLNCGEEDLKANCNYCSNCGQKLDWEVENETNENE